MLMLVVWYYITNEGMIPDFRSQASLFFSEVLLGVGSAFNAKWVADGKIAIGNVCTAQGLRASSSLPLIENLLFFLGAVKHLANAAFGLASFVCVKCYYVTTYLKL
jgi:hypothetical protein